MLGSRDGDAPSFPYPVALCDIGGTNVRLSELTGPTAAPGAITHAHTDEYADLAKAVEALSASFTQRPRSLVVCAAGPVEGRRVKLTNARWTVDGPQVAAALGLEQGLLLNDFEAQAITLPTLGGDGATSIGDVVAPPNEGTRLVLGPGTGLGVGLLVPWQGRLMPLMSEAGHMDFGPSNASEYAVWDILHRTLPRVTGESLLSGPGTVRLYEALCAIEGVSPRSQDASEITRLAQSTSDGVEARTLRMFWTLVARFAGGLAMGLLATGGVALSGGILRKITGFLDPQAFRQAFENQQPLHALVAKIPVTLVSDESSIYGGLAGLAANPSRFMIDYRARAWK